MRLAEEGLGLLSSTVDTLIVIPNQNLFQLVDKQTSLLDSFRCGSEIDGDGWGIGVGRYLAVSWLGVGLEIRFRGEWEWGWRKSE